MQKLRFQQGIGDILRYYSLCPSCKATDSLVCHPDGFTLSCPDCGYTMRWNEYGFLVGKPSYISTPADWEKLEQKTYAERFENGKFFSDPDVTLCSTNEAFQKTPLASGTLSSDAEKLSIADRAFPYSELEGLEVLNGGSTLVFTHKGEHYLLSTSGGNLAKYLYLYEWGKEK